jgi:hypothetical protein
VTDANQENATPAPATLTLEQRIEHLEDAVHALGTHTGTNHPSFRAFAERIGARIKAGFASAKKTLDESAG